MVVIPQMPRQCVISVPGTPTASSPPDEVSFRLSPFYGVHTAREAHEWFLLMMRSHDEFVVETDRAGEAPVPFYTETVRRVVVE